MFLLWNKSITFETECACGVCCLWLGVNWLQTTVTTSNSMSTELWTRILLQWHDNMPTLLHYFALPLHVIICYSSTRFNLLIVFIVFVVLFETKSLVFFSTFQLLKKIGDIVSKNRILLIGVLYCCWLIDSWCHYVSQTLYFLPHITNVFI